MADITLTPKPLLDGLEIATDTCALREVTDVALASVAIPQGGEAAFDQALGSAFGLEMPTPTQTTVNDTARAARIAPDQILLMLSGRADVHIDDVEAAFAQSGYVTDQSGSWVLCEVSGPGAIRALERLCPIDLHDSAFPVGAYARTVMEHMGAGVLRIGPERFWLMSASSSARSFAHALELSLRYTA